MSTDPDLELRKFLAPELVFGPGARNLVSQYVQNLDLHKVLLVSDPGVHEAGWTEDIANILRKDGIEYEYFLGITPNPKNDEAIAGAEYFLSSSCEGIVAVGGGSAMDCAKIIGVLSTNPGEPEDFVGIDQVKDATPPLICIPTTAGSSAVVSQFAVMTDTRKRKKTVYASKLLVPDAALIDPETTVTMNGELTAATGIDALAHAFEAYVSNAHTPLTDIHAEEAARLIFTFLQPCLRDRDNILLRSRVMRASLEAGLAFSNASLGMIHALAHSLGGYTDAPHGECNAFLLPAVISHNWSCSSERYQSIAEKAGIIREPEKAKDALISYIEEFVAELGLEFKYMNDLSPGDIERMARNAIADPCLLTNPTSCSLGDIIELYRKTSGIGT